MLTLGVVILVSKSNVVSLYVASGMNGYCVAKKKKKLIQ